MNSETPEGVDTMCKAIEENNKRIEKNKAIAIALKLIRAGCVPYTVISDSTDLTLEEVEKLAETLDHTA